MSRWVFSGPSMTWRMPEATRRPLWWVRCTITASVPDALCSSLSRGRSSTAAVRGSAPRGGSSSLATSSDCNTTRSDLSIGSTS